MKKLVAFLLCCMMLMGSASAVTLSTDYHDYVDWPITDQGYTYNIGLKLESAVSDWSIEKNWFFNWAMEKTGLKFEFELIQGSALKDQKQLLFNSDQLPDVMFSWDITPTEMVRYGVEEGMLMPLNDYIKPEIMPHLCKWLEAYPQAVVNMTAPDGNYYSLPLFYKITASAGSSSRVFINQTYLDENNIEKPQTLEDLVKVLYDYKEANPGFTPIASCAANKDLRDYFLNSFGFVCQASDDYGMGLSLKNGKIVVAAADPTFKEFLTLMNKFYNDGIIYKDFFLMDADVLDVTELALECLMIGSSPTGNDYSQWSHWTASYPLTSEYSSERKYLGSDLFRVGGLCLSSKCEHVEEFMCFMDFFYCDLGAIYTWDGPLAGSEDAMGRDHVGFYINDEGYPVNVGVESGKYESGYIADLYLCMPGNKRVGVNACSVDHPELTTANSLEGALVGLDPPESPWDVKGSKDNYFRASMEEFVSPYETTAYPFYVYMSVDQTNRVNELKTVIDPYVEKEVAAFITGARSLDEFDQFVSELEGMGIREYEQLYQDATNLK